VADILHLLKVKAPADRVYRALVEKEGLSGWWMPGVVAQPRVGSIVEIQFAGGAVVKLKIDRLEPGKNVTWSAAEGVPDWDNTLITWDLTPVDGGTDVLFSHRRFVSTDGMYARFNISWAWHIISLKDYVETGKGDPGPAPWFRPQKG